MFSFTEKIIIRGGGDLATGVAQKFFRAGFPVAILETHTPTAIRRSVSLCEAAYDGFACVDDLKCRKVADTDKMESCWQDGIIPLLVDPTGESIRTIRPAAVIDAIIAKRCLGTNRAMADITIALGPGFRAGEDVDIVIETMRGHDLGRLIFSGSAMPNTGIPGEVGGQSARRVLHAPVSGIVVHKRHIGDVVGSGDVLLTIGGMAVNAPFGGLLRGLIREGIEVPQGMKVADVDPRTDVNWRAISDKARCLGGAALEAYFFLKQNGENR
ncbi:MAG: selenium-dependent molybdenum cofactor biosynthesis protein YqeB [Treponema sp.]|nr:selenium-dependent molybdenum cofactor biosynthesis protein YqeB [Treponema sp.]